MISSTFCKRFSVHFSYSINPLWRNGALHVAVYNVCTLGKVDFSLINQGGWHAPVPNQSWVTPLLTPAADSIFMPKQTLEGSHQVAGDWVPASQRKSRVMLSIFSFSPIYREHLGGREAGGSTLFLSLCSSKAKKKNPNYLIFLFAYFRNRRLRRETCPRKEKSHL